MSSFSLILFLLGILGVVVTVVWLVINLIKKKSSKKLLKIFGASLALAILGVILNPGNSTPPAVTETVAPVVEEKTPEEIKIEADAKIKADAEAKVIAEQKAKDDAAAKAIADAEAEIKKALIQPGMYKVGTDIKAGEYVVISEQGAYIQVSKDSTGTLESIIANENIQNRTIITIKDGQYFEVKNGDTYPISKAPKAVPTDNQLPAGMYKVGLDIQPGEYKVTADGSGYVEVASNSSHDLYSIVSNDNFEGEKYITIKQGQYLKLGNAVLKLK